MSCLTTLKLTSASSSARRMSRSASSMYSSVSLACPRRPLNARWSFSCKFSNIGMMIHFSSGKRLELSASSRKHSVGRLRCGARHGGSDFVEGLSQNNFAGIGHGCVLRFPFLSSLPLSYLYPPPPRSIGIIDLAENGAQDLGAQ